MAVHGGHGIPSSDVWTSALSGLALFEDVIGWLVGSPANRWIARVHASFSLSLSPLFCLSLSPPSLSLFSSSLLSVFLSP